jgi:hypothetical protein
MHGSDFSRATERTPKMSKKGSQTDCERRRWCVPWPYAKSGFCASCAENHSIISPAMSRSPPTVFRCSTSASEWARAIIWLLGLAARACFTTFLASKASRIAVITYFAPARFTAFNAQVVRRCQRLPQCWLPEDQR